MINDSQEIQEIGDGTSVVGIETEELPTNDEGMGTYLSQPRSDGAELLNFDLPKDEFEKRAKAIDDRYSFTDLVKSIDGVNGVLANVQKDMPIREPDGKVTALIRKVPFVGNAIADRGKNKKLRNMSAGSHIVSLQQRAGESIRLLERNLEATEKLATEIEEKLARVGEEIKNLEDFLKKNPTSSHKIRINQRLVNLYTIREVYRGRLQEISQHIGAINISKDSLGQEYPVIIDQIEVGVVTLQSLTITRKVQETRNLLKTIGEQMVIGASQATQEVVAATINMLKEPIISSEILDEAAGIQAETRRKIKEAPRQIAEAQTELLDRFRQNNEGHVPVENMIPDWSNKVHEEREHQKKK